MDGRNGGLLLAGIVAALLLLSGCLSPIVMHRAVLEYDRTVSQVEAELLLLNIARARHYRPVHFTAVSSVAATFDFRVSAGILGRVGGLGPDSDNAPVDLQYATEVAENPTVTIIPIAGEEFTKRILRPLEESHFNFLARQGFDLGMVLRLMARGIAIQGDGEPRTVLNRPARREDYGEFRRRLLHLSALHGAGKLRIAPIMYEERYPVALDRALTHAEALTAIEHGYRWIPPAAPDQAAVLSRRTTGRLTITNYDIHRLGDEARRRLNEEIERFPLDHVFVDVRPDGPGGDYPLRGYLLLRSFNAIVAFLARGVAEESEFPVEQDPRTDVVPRNPARTLEIDESDHEPADGEFSVFFEGKHYTIRKFPITEGMVPSWNQEAFTVLSNLFQMTVTDVSTTRAPIISIPKGG